MIQRNRPVLSHLAVPAFVLAVLALAPVPAAAGTYHFTCISSPAACTPDVGNQMSVTVTSGGAGLVNFTFTNNVGIPSSIADIYVADKTPSPGTLLSLVTPITMQSAGVSFSQGAAPPQLPGGGAFNSGNTAYFTADSDSPVSHNGINAASEWLTLQFNLRTGKTLNDVLNAMNAGLLQVGLHVQAIGTRGDSASYVSVVPEPGFYGLLSLGLAGLYAAVARRRRKSTPAE
mgnify:CR=1 FL=1